MNKRVKSSTSLLGSIILMLLLAVSGCNNAGSVIIKGETPCFTPQSIGFRKAFCRITPDSDGNCRVVIFTHILDAYGDSMKLPGIFRVELYKSQQQTRPYSPGNRLAVNEQGYVEFDLRSADINNKYWDSFTRAYDLEFVIDNCPGALFGQVTWIYTDSYRLTENIELKKILN